MGSYNDIIGTDDPLVPPSDTLSDAMYNNTKLDYILAHSQNNEEEEEVEDLEVEVSNHDNHHNSVIKGTKDSHSSISQWKLLKVIAGAHMGWIRTLDIDPVTNKWFATGSTDNTIKIWDLANLNLKSTITGHIMAVRSLKISNKFPFLFSGSEDKTVRCWDLERTNSPLGCQIRDYHGHVGGIFAMDIHPELDLLLTGGRDAVVRVWDIRSRAEIMTLTGHRNDISSIISSVSDPQIVTSSMDSTIRLWDIRKHTTELTIAQHSKSIRLLIDHPNESTMCSGDSLGRIKQWTLPQGDLLNEFGTNDGIINTLSINHTNNQLFAGYDDGKLEFYDYINGDLLQSSKTIPSPGSNESTIYCSSFDHLGLRLLTGESDNSIKVWGES